VTLSRFLAGSSLLALKLQLPTNDVAPLYWLLPLFGFLVGVLVGLTGMGGGVLVTPFLMLIVGLPPSVAVGTDLAYAGLTKVAGALQHWRQGTIDTRLMRDLALGSVPASLIAVQLLVWWRRQNPELAERSLERLIGLALLLVALSMLWRLVRSESHRDRTGPIRNHNRKRVIAIGALGGFLVGLTSIGSGSVILALLVLTAATSTDRLVGTDIAHAAILVGTAALGHLFIGDINFRLVALLLVGSVPGVLLGSRLTVRLPERFLRALLASLLILCSIPMLRG
jgi:uncharacterized membrane protein YfcA